MIFNIICTLGPIFEHNINTINATMNMETKVRSYAMPNIVSKGTSEEGVLGRFTVITAEMASRDHVQTPGGLFVLSVDEGSKSTPSEEGDFGRD